MQLHWTQRHDRCDIGLVCTFPLSLQLQFVCRKCIKVHCNVPFSSSQTWTMRSAFATFHPDLNLFGELLVYNHTKFVTTNAISKCATSEGSNKLNVFERKSEVTTGEISPRRFGFSIDISFSSAQNLRRLFFLMRTNVGVWFQCRVKFCSSKVKFS